MQAASVQSERTTDIASTVVATMRQMGVVALPRNYEIFYEALTGANQQLALDLVSLSKRPTQSELDELGRKHFGQNHGHRIVEQAREIIAHELEDVARLLRTERTSLERYGEILNETSNGLADPRVVNKDILAKIASVMAVATETTIDHGRQLAATLGEKTVELENVKSKLEEYKKLADTDALTQVANRRAFDRQLAYVYSDPKVIMFSSLILVDIDRFKEINDRFGHPIGDKIIQAIANILQASIRGQTFIARTGGEEFALILDGVGEEGVMGISERLRNAIAQTPFSNPQTGAPLGSITVSVGICMASEADSAEDLYAKADRALYRSKVNGRNRITAYASLIETRPGKNWMLYRSE
ncbi:GGDEF domain-containing protein [Arvimicrobium flavum]|uniref:GGDEF domain-containing protein n=1 Tax=Arvimicrobium flavum TaxID=3393320 RepID=UPI00237BA86A|nr:GGDEF domain-containing protein [Mesorhizobium shangrilense]